jgi:precorrin-6B methylase 1
MNAFFFSLVVIDITGGICRRKPHRKSTTSTGNNQQYIDKSQRERERCVCVPEKERERESVCVYVCARERNMKNRSTVEETLSSRCHRWSTKSARVDD